MNATLPPIPPLWLDWLAKQQAESDLRRHRVWMENEAKKAEAFKAEKGTEAKA